VGELGHHPGPRAVVNRSVYVLHLSVENGESNLESIGTELPKKPPWQKQFLPGGKNSFFLRVIDLLINVNSL
jgi:hypothetical protein